MSTEGSERPELHKRQTFLLLAHTMLNSKTYYLSNNANASYNLICMYVQHF